MISDKLKQTTKKAAGVSGFKMERIHLEHPADPTHGDYSSNIALQVASQTEQNPREIAQKILENLKKPDFIEKIEIADPGFINFWLTDEWLMSRAAEMASGQPSGRTFLGFGPQYHLGPNHKVMVEYAHPNTHKRFHIGHLRNITIGESIARILETSGNEVIRANYQGDVGLHIAKVLYAVRQNLDKKDKLKTLEEKIDFLGRMYVIGNQAYEEDVGAREEIIQLNRAIYNRDDKVMPLWQETRDWSLRYFEKIYERLYTQYNRYYFESEVFERGLEISREALEKGVLEENDGAVIFSGKPYNLDTRVFITQEGFPTYEAKELGLAELEFSEFGELDKNIHVVAPEQTSFFKVTFKVEKLLDPDKYKDKQYHLAYGYVQLKEGKMSSRLGTVVEGPQLLDEVKERLRENFPEIGEETLEMVTVGAVKYSMLKFGVHKDIAFDIDESISLEGNSGPYLQYTHARCKSVLREAGREDLHRLLTAVSNYYRNGRLNAEEEAILRVLYQFPEVIQTAAAEFAPNKICDFLFDLAQKYNSFYQKHRILDAPEGGETVQLRLMLTAATAQVVSQGLDLLGIASPNRM